MKYNKKVTITTILISLILTATPSIAQADVKSTAEQPKVMDLWFEVASPLKTLTPQALPNQHIYTINSKYNAELGCTTPISLGDEKTPINRNEDAYLCNANIESEFISQEPDLSKFHEVMLAQRDKISNSRIVKMSQEKILFSPDPPPRYNINIKVDEYTVAVASCNEQQNCTFSSMPAFERLKNIGVLAVAHTPLAQLSDSQITFSKFSDGVNSLPNFISEVNTIKFYSDKNTLLYEVKPKTSPLYMSNFYSTKVPFGTYKAEICTTYEFCFTTWLADSVATYLESSNPARTFALNITNTNLANYQKVGLTVQNGNFATANFEKTLTLKYTVKGIIKDTVKATRISTYHQELQSNNKINKNYLNPEICDDTTCLPATILPSSNCPNNPTICLTATFTPIKKKTVIYGQLIQPDGSPAPFGSLVFYPNRDYFSTVIKHSINMITKKPTPIRIQITDFLRSEAYQAWPEYKKIQRFSADKDGMITFTLDLDHYYSKVARCNINTCLPDKTNLFAQSMYILPNDGKALLITVPSNEYTSKNKKDKKPVQLKPGMVISGKVLAEVNKAVKQETYGISTSKYLSPGSYLKIFTANGSATSKTPTDEQGNFSLTLPANFTRLEICSALNVCHNESKLNKFYYLNIDQKDTLKAKIFTFPAPKNNLGMLRGKLYDLSKEIVSKNKKNINNKEVFLLNAKGELISTLKTDSNGEFFKNLNYIVEKKITQIEGDSLYYNEINYNDIELYFDAQMDYPYQVVSGVQMQSIAEIYPASWKDTIIYTAGAIFWIVTLIIV